MEIPLPVRFSFVDTVANFYFCSLTFVLLSGFCRSNPILVPVSLHFVFLSIVTSLLVLLFAVLYPLVTNNLIYRSGFSEWASDCP